MNKNLKSAMPIIAALPKTKGWLRTTEGYCAIGALCEAYHQQTGQGTWEPEVDHFVFEGRRALMPVSVQRHFNISLDKATEIHMLNDNSDKTIPEIIKEIIP